MKKLFALCPLMVMATASYANPNGVSPIPLGNVLPSLPVKTYCNASNTAVPAGTYVPYANSTIDTSVANTTKITETDGTNIYITTITTATSGIGSVVTVPACALKQ